VTTIFGDTVVSVALLAGYPEYVLAVVVNPFTRKLSELPIRKDQLQAVPVPLGLLRPL
jgi:hypothetical protein